MRLFTKLGLALIALLFAFSSCTPDESVSLPTANPSTLGAEVALRFHDIFLDLERFSAGYRPPVSARSSAYISLTGYEALVAAMPRRNSMAAVFNIPGLPELEAGEDYHWEAALTEAYTESIIEFFPTAPAEQLARLFRLRSDLFARFKQEVSHEVFSRSTAYGQEVAQAIFAWSATDVAGHEAFLRNNDPTYAPPSGQSLWQPTFPDFTPALLPRWGDVRTFVADESDRIPPPLAYSNSPSSEIYQQAAEVAGLVNEIKAGGQEDAHWIAEFWSDDCPILTFTPAGRWYAIANQLVERENMRLDAAVEFYARVGIALSDAGVKAWEEKYRYNYQRPIDYIRAVMPNQTNWNTVMCPDGSGNYFTPNFPAYPSGHATFGAAAVVIYEDFFGTDVGMTDRCHEGRTEFRGDPRTFSRFREMAEENAYSRIPLGVHFKMDSDAGLELGYGIGEKVNRLPWRR